MRIRFTRWYWFPAVILLCGILAISIPRGRIFILRSAAHLIVVEQPLPSSADVIVVSIDALGAGTLEAADLVHGGVSNRVAVFVDPPTQVDREFLRRGLPYDDKGSISAHQLQLLGVQNIERIPRSTSGSEQEGEILPEWCEKQGYRSAVLVTSADHSRRLTRIFRRALRDRKLSITVHSSRYSTFNPDGWWKTRAGVRNGILELQKLFLDFLRHPFF